MPPLRVSQRWRIGLRRCRRSAAGVDPVSWTPREWGSTMPKTNKTYPDEFKKRMIGLVREGRTPEALAREFEPSAQAIRNWVAQADREAGRRQDGLTTGEREELQR